MAILEGNNMLGIRKYVVGKLFTNCYLVYDIAAKKGVLIDPGAYVPAIDKFIKGKGIDVLWIINTHGHADHIAGNSAFGFPVLIHELDSGALSDSSKNLSFLSGETVPTSRAAKFLKDKDSISLGKVKLDVIHTPGHTPGSISLIFEDSLFSGDTLFYEGVGRTDLPGGSYRDLVDSITKKLFILPETVKVFPGHGQDTAIGHERCNFNVG